MLRPLLLFWCLWIAVSMVFSGCADPAGPRDDPSATAGSASFLLFGGASISLEKLTEGEDADASPGPSLTPGETVVWEYRVTNTGSEGLLDVYVMDDKEGPICSGLTLNPGEVASCWKSGVVQIGSYENEGTATGTSSVTFLPVTDTDLSHYQGGASGQESVGIDVKPGSESNSLNPCSKGRLPVAILADTGFDPMTLVPESILAGGLVAPVQWGKGGEDVNGDGVADLVVHFKTPELNDAGLLQDDDGDDEVELFITAEVSEASGGGSVSGSDVIQLVHGQVCR